MLAYFGKDPKRVVTNVGNEQEYFLIKKEAYRKRRDLVITGRTLFGAAPCKGQSSRSTTSVPSVRPSPPI